MALTRKWLSALGIEQDKIEEIVTAHGETIDGLKEKIRKAEEAAAELAEAKKKIASLEEAAKHSGDYDKLKKEFDDYKAEVHNKEVAAAKKAALTAVAKDAGLSEAGIAKALKYTDLATVELDENGNAKDGKNLIKSLRDEWPEYIETTKTEGARTENPAAGGKVAKTREEILAIKDTAERQAAWHDFLVAQQKG